MHFDVVYNPFDVKCKFRIGSPKYLFLWCLILAVKWIKKRVSGNDWKLLPWDSYRVRQTNHLYTIHFKSMFLFKKHPPFQRHFLTSILTPDVSYTFPKISEVPLYHATDFTSKPLMFIPKSEELCDQNVSQLFFRVRWFSQSNKDQHRGIHIYPHIMSLEPSSTVFQLWICIKLF